MTSIWKSVKGAGTLIDKVYSRVSELNKIVPAIFVGIPHSVGEDWRRGAIKHKILSQVIVLCRVRSIVGIINYGGNYLSPTFSIGILST